MDLVDTAVWKVPVDSQVVPSTFRRQLWRRPDGQYVAIVDVEVPPFFGATWWPCGQTSPAATPEATDAAAEQVIAWWIERRAQLRREPQA